MKAVALLLLCICVSAVALPSPSNGTVSLAWDASISPGISNYTIYYGIGPATVLGWNGTNVVCGCYTNTANNGTNLTLTINGLLRGQTYYFAVTAISTNGSESDFSNEVRLSVPIKPGNPKNLTVQ